MKRAKAVKNSSLEELQKAKKAEKAFLDSLNIAKEISQAITSVERKINSEVQHDVEIRNSMREIAQAKDKKKATGGTGTIQLAPVVPPEPVVSPDQQVPLLLGLLPEQQHSQWRQVQ